MKTALIVLGATVITLADVEAAKSACGQIWAVKLKDSREYAQRRADFQVDDKFVVCIRLPEEAFVSVWDAPPRGDVSRLFPNVLTHQNNASIRAEKLAGGEHCFGTSSPLYFPAEQGIGHGKLSLIATAALEDQPKLRDFKIPGETIERSTMERLARTYNITDDCKAKFQESMEYRITQ